LSTKVLVTGGTGEIGLAVVDLLGSAGAEVAVADERGAALERIAIRLGVATELVDAGSSNGTRVAGQVLVAQSNGTLAAHALTPASPTP